MTHTAAMLETAPTTPRYDLEALSRSIDSCLDCAQACTACADACLAEENVAKLTRCISLTLTCADVCAATAFALSRQMTSDDAAVRALVDSCITAGSAQTRAPAAPRNASTTQPCMLTAGSAQKPVAPANGFAASCWPAIRPLTNSFARPAAFAGRTGSYLGV